MEKKEMASWKLKLDTQKYKKKKVRKLKKYDKTELQCRSKMGSPFLSIAQVSIVLFCLAGRAPITGHGATNPAVRD